MRSAEGRRRLLASGIPVVETWDLTPTPIDMLVGFSHEKVGRGHGAIPASARAIAGRPIVTGDDQRANLRRAGFEQAWQALGGAAVPVQRVPAPTTLGSGRAALRAAAGGGPGDRRGGLQLRRAGARRDHRGAGARPAGARRHRRDRLRRPRLRAARASRPSRRCASTAPPSAGRRRASSSTAPKGARSSTRCVDLGFSLIERDSA